MKQEMPLRKELLAGAKAGHLLQAVFANLSSAREEREDLAGELVALHNEEQVDVVAAFEGLRNSASGGPDFFLTRHVFEKALPHLNAPVAPVMRCVLGLFREAGQDMAAGTIFHSYIEFCTRDPARPREALNLIKEDPGALTDMLAATVAAGSQFDNPYYLAELLRLIRHPDIEVRRRAVFATTTIHWAKGASVPNTAVTALEETVAAEMDDRTLGSAIKSSFALFEQDKTLEDRIVVLIEAALTKGAEFSLHAASELLWHYTNELPPSLLKVLLKQLKRVAPANVGTLKNIDHGIARLLKQNDPAEALRFLEERLAANTDSLKIEVLKSTTCAIRESAALIGKVLIRWFLSGKRELNEAVHAIAIGNHDKDLRIDIDASELKPVDHVHILFIARKAIGYLFMTPTTAASVVISLMRYAPDDETLDALGELLFDPVLLNYPGGTREYIEDQARCESGKVRETIESAVASIEQYLDVLRAVPNLPALHVGLTQRESYRRRMSETMAGSMKAAEKESFFSSFCSRSTLLYGNKSINYVYAGDGEPHRMEIPLTSHSISMEFPRIDNIDPYGLDYMLRVFRQEQFRA